MELGKTQLTSPPNDDRAPDRAACTPPPHPHFHSPPGPTTEYPRVESIRSVWRRYFRLRELNGDKVSCGPTTRPDHQVRHLPLPATREGTTSARWQHLAVMTNQGARQIKRAHCELSPTRPQGTEKVHFIWSEITKGPDGNRPPSRIRSGVLRGRNTRQHPRGRQYRETGT